MSVFASLIIALSPSSTSNEFGIIWLLGKINPYRPVEIQKQNLFIFLETHFSIVLISLLLPLSCSSNVNVSGTFLVPYTQSTELPEAKSNYDKNRQWTKFPFENANSQRYLRNCYHWILTYKLCLQYSLRCIRFHIGLEWLLLFSIQFFAAMRKCQQKYLFKSFQEVI